MPITSGQIDINKGITTPQGITISWDDFNSRISADQQKQLLSSMGLSSDEITQLQGALQKTEISQYKQYQADQAYKKQEQGSTTGEGIVQGITDLIHGKAPTWFPFFGGSGPDDKSLAQLQQSGGLTDVIKNLGISSAISGATSAQQQQQLPPAYSAQNLANYTNNFLIPFVDHVNSMVKGDLSNWGSAINKMTSQLGIPSNVAGNLVPTQSEAALYQTLAPLLAQQQLTSDYVNRANAAMSESATVGAREAAASGTIQNLQAYGLVGPGTINSMMNTGIGTTGGIGMPGTTGTTTGSPTPATISNYIGGVLGPTP